MKRPPWWMYLTSAIMSIAALVISLLNILTQ